MNVKEAAAKLAVKHGVLYNNTTECIIETDADGNYLVTRGKIVIYRGGTWSQAWARYNGR